MTNGYFLPHTCPTSTNRRWPLHKYSVIRIASFIAILGTYWITSIHFQFVYYLRQFWRRLCYQSCLYVVCWFVFKITQKVVDGLKRNLREMLIIIKWRPSSILSKIGTVLFELAVFNGVFVPHLVYVCLWRH